MAGVIKSFLKAANERRRLYLDYTCWLEDTETLTDLQVSISPLTEAAPLIVNTAYTDVDHKKLTMYVSGGIAGTVYRTAIVVRTNQGQVKQDVLGFKVTT
jgi:hypothetical protein